MGKNTNVRIAANIDENILAEIEYNKLHKIPNQNYKAVVLARLERVMFDAGMPPEYVKNEYNAKKKQPRSVFVTNDVIKNINREIEYHLNQQNLFGDFSAVVNARLFKTMWVASTPVETSENDRTCNSWYYVCFIARYVR